MHFGRSVATEDELSCAIKDEVFEGLHRLQKRVQIAAGRLRTEQLQMTGKHLDLSFKEGLWEGVGLRGAEQEEQPSRP